MRVFIFGIDGLTMRIMKPLMDRRQIPNFQSLYEHGNMGLLKSTIPPLTPPGWASIYTGKNPGKHGLFEFRKKNGYAFETNMCWDYNEAPPVWKYLSDNERKCILLNVPMYYPPLRIQNCYSVSGFHAIETLNIYHPESLGEEFKEKLPNYKIDSSWKDGPSRGREETYIKDNIEVTKKRIEAMKYLMKEKPWDFFFVVFTGADRFQHFFWDEIINGHPEIDQYYKLLDDAIGYVLNFLRKDDFFFIVSDHGFCPIHTAVNINKVLQQKGLLSIKKSVEIPINYRKLEKLIEKLGVSNILKKILPKKFINKVQKHTKVEGTFAFSKIDWTNTKAFASSIYGGIYINLKNREPNGIVSMSEYESARDNIIQVFSSLTGDKKEGRRVIKSIYKREEIYSGKHLQEMPDLILLAEPGYRFDETIDKGDIFREPRSRKNRHIIVGDHEVNTIFMVKNDSFRKRLNEVSVTDIAPSVLNLFAIPIPTSMDGKSLFEDYIPPIYRDELTGAVFEKQNGRSRKIKSKLKKLRI